MPETRKLSATHGGVTRRAFQTSAGGAKGAFVRMGLPVLLGLLLWLAVDMKRTEETTVEAGFRLENRLPPGWELVEPLPRTVHATIRGTRQAIADVRTENMRVTADLPAGALGGDSYAGMLTLLPSEVKGVPSGVEVTAIIPEVVPVSLAKMMTKYVAVEPGELTGLPAPGYAVGKVSPPDPTAMPLVAPKPFLDKIGPNDVIRTKPFSIEGGRDMASGNIELLPFEKDGVSIPVPGQVYLSVELPEIPETREFPELVEVRALISSPFDKSSDLTLSPSSARVTISGPQALVDRLAAGDVTVYVDLRDRVPAAAGEFNLKCRALAPSGVQVTRIEPDSVKWVIKEAAPPAGASGAVSRNGTDAEEDGIWGTS